MNINHPWSGGYVHTSSSDARSHSCGCIGPQDGNPRCPCMMQNMRQVDGRWVETIDHGPVQERHLTLDEQKTFDIAFRKAMAK